MSARSKYEFEFAQAARKDFREILKYTDETWGPRQRKIYRDKINKALKTIAADPAKGRKETEHLHSFRAEHHRIFYRVAGETIYIIRILHARMDFPRHL